MIQWDRQTEESIIPNQNKHRALIATVRISIVFRDLWQAELQGWSQLAAFQDISLGPASQTCFIFLCVRRHAHCMKHNQLQNEIFLCG